MAKKRMFDKEIIESDDFLDLPTGSRCLYIHACMDADDEGFFNGLNKIARVSGATKDDVSILLEKKYIYKVDENLYLITHWAYHNRVRKDRYIKSKYENYIDKAIQITNGMYKRQFSKPKK